jgi:hypothetical protein
MIEYVVTMRKLRECVRHYYDDNDLPEGGQEVFLPIRSQGWDVNEMSEGLWDCMTTYFLSPKQAAQFAERLAKENPGKEIILSKCEAVFSAMPAEVVRKSITDKGVLPS